MGKNINKHFLIKIATYVAKKIGIALPPNGELLKQVNEQIGFPLILQNDQYQMWFDKYYIAFSNIDESEVHYVYVAKFHIEEEIKSFKVARRRGSKRVYLPKGITNTFKKAMAIMEKTGWDYYVSDYYKKR